MQLLLPFLIAVSLLTAACGSEAPPEIPEAPAPAPRRALWVLAEGSHRTLDDPARIDALVRNAVDLGVTDLLVQVHRGGRSWFHSTHADAAPHTEIVRSTGVDPLPRLIERAHAADVRVHAWFNCLSLARNARAPLLAKVGRDAVLVDREGRSLLDYPGYEVPKPDRSHTRMGTPGLWLDPATPGVIEYLEATLDDLIAAAPGLDGLHLDFVRHPMALPLLPGSRFDGLDFGYGAPARKRFSEQNGGFKRGDAWDGFRRDAVGELVRRLDARLPEGWEHSAAVIAYPDRAYLTAMQDWRRWLEEGWLDFAVAMAYTRDDALLRYQAHGLSGGIAGDRVWLGLGSWLFLTSPERMARQIELASAAQPAGVVLFSYDSLVDHDGALEQLPWRTTE